MNVCTVEFQNYMYILTSGSKTINLMNCITIFLGSIKSMFGQEISVISCSYIMKI